VAEQAARRRVAAAEQAAHWRVAAAEQAAHWRVAAAEPLNDWVSIVLECYFENAACTGGTEEVGSGGGGGTEFFGTDGARTKKC
jgi:membrane protein involved in colicin uptake